MLTSELQHANLDLLIQLDRLLKEADQARILGATAFSAWPGRVSPQGTHGPERPGGSGGRPCRIITPPHPPPPPCQRRTTPPC